ncbi:stage II sporulation protein M [Martelella mangrovi]|uniref:Membrane protein SpoIIM required for sporulation n=1 Tax=Martelella mangrovi TaxID=1397477 RepID=A0ABV2IFT7_9HYPH
MRTSGETIRSSRFRSEREGDWLRLQAIVEQAERRGLKSLAFSDSRDLVTLYRQAVNALSVAREISLDSAIIAYLESLSARAYLVVYAPRASLSGVVSRFFATGAPGAFRRSGIEFIAAYALMALGAVAAFLLTQADPTWFYAFVPDGLAAGRGPQASADALRRVIYDSEPGALDQLGAFATYLFSHNTRIAIFAFVLGIMACVPSAVLILYNGTMIGALGSIYADKGLGYDLFAWLSIHGVTELSAIVIATAGGFRLGRAFLFPGEKTRKASLAYAAHDAVKLAVLAAIMLLAAGVLEGFARQLVTAPAWRIAIGWGIGALWFVWLIGAGRQGNRSTELNPRETGAHVSAGEGAP